MMGSVVLPYVAGLVTLLNPCVLPILPIIIGSALGENRYGPAALAAGLVLSFSIFGFLLLTVGFSIGLDPEAMRLVAAAILIAAGILLTVPAAQTYFATVTGPIANSGNRLLRGCPAAASAASSRSGRCWASCGPRASARPSASPSLRPAAARISSRHS
jgi:cytochrome c-type biogenesis protein